MRTSYVLVSVKSLKRFFNAPKPYLAVGNDGKRNFVLIFLKYISKYSNNLLKGVNVCCGFLIMLLFLRSITVNQGKGNDEFYAKVSKVE